MPRKNFAYINPDILKWGRLETPLSLAEIVAKTGFSESDLNNWEAGEEYPSVNEAKALSKLYDIPFAALYLPEPPKEQRPIIRDNRTLSASGKGELSYTLWKDINSFLSMRETALECLDDFPLSGHGLDSIISDTSDTITIADSLRKYIGIETPYLKASAFNGNPFNFYRKKLELSGILVFQFSGTPISEARGLSIYYDTLPIIAVNKEDSVKGKVFSLFHELAHLYRRSSSICLIDVNDSDKEEKKCDEIAANILLPKSSMLAMPLVLSHKGPEWTDDELDILSSKFGVSKEAALRRLLTLGKTSRDFYFSKHNEYKIEYDEFRKRLKETSKESCPRIKYHIRYLSSVGSLFPSIVLNNYANGNITYNEVSRALKVKSKHLGDIEQAVMFK